MLLKYKTCYATHSTPFRIPLKPNAQLMTQRPSKVPIHYRDKPNVLLKELENITLSNKLVSLHKTNPFMAQPI